MMSVKTCVSCALIIAEAIQLQLILNSLTFPELLMILATAVGYGLLIGLERERNNHRGHEQSFAGLRSFTLCALLGAVCFLLNTAVGIVGTCAIISFCLYSLFKQQQDIGATTELAFLLTYFIGAICIWNKPLAAGLAVLLAIILMAKQTLHQFVGNRLKDYELRDGLFLLALILIALPLMPNQPLWGTVLNPYVIVKLLILILFVQSLAHVAKHILPRSKALVLSAVASGFVSSTATIASLGMEVRSGKASALANAGAALMSCVATLIQLLIIVLGINLQWFKLLLLPCVVGCSILVVAALFMIRKAKTQQHAVNEADSEQLPPQEHRIFSIQEAGMIVVMLTAIQTGVYALNVALGDHGLIIGTLLASLFEVHAAMATVVMQGSIHNMTLIYAVVVGLIAHALSKCMNAYLTGGAQYFKYFAPIQILHMLCLITVLAWMIK